MDDSDEELYRRWAEGEVRSGSRLVDRYLGAMSRFFANKVTQSGDVEDLVGRTFELCVRSLGRFERASSFRTYLYGIARKVLRDYIKKKSRQPAAVDFETTMLRDLGPSASIVAGAKAEQRLLVEALRSIPIEYQIAIELSFFEELTRREMAEILELPPGTVASRIRRAQTLLHEAMEAAAASPEILRSTRRGLESWIRAVRGQLSEDPGPPDASD
jgi:RNA polymerase sigma-70 factor (ECF subfamily)